MIGVEVQLLVKKKPTMKQVPEVSQSFETLCGFYNFVFCGFGLGFFPLFWCDLFNYATELEFRGCTRK